MLENGDVPDEDDDEVVEEGKVTCGCIAEDGVGGGGSKVFACVFRVVGESVDRLRVPPRNCAGSDCGIDVWRESLGLLGAGGLVGGITDSIAPATCFLSSDVCGDASRCRDGRLWV